MGIEYLQSTSKTTPIKLNFKQYYVVETSHNIQLKDIMLKKLHISLLFAACPILLTPPTLLPYQQQEHPDFPIFTQTESITLNTLYGKIHITEPALIELIESQPLQRLKEIYQLGIWRYSVKDDHFTRYDHSIGVFTLVRIKGGTLREQIAALLHDVSHTAFSHVGAFFFVDDNKEMDAFQDNLHEWYIHATGISDILKKHGFPVDKVSPKDPAFKRLEQDLPHLCADRIDYNIRGALWNDLITPEQAISIINDLQFTDGFWYFNTRESALLLAHASLNMTVTMWGSAENFATGQWLAQALKRAASLGIITKNDLYFSTDTIVWKKMMDSNDAEILNNLNKIKDCYNHFELDDTNYTTFTKGKFRGLNPVVKTERGYYNLLDIDQNYAYEYQTAQKTLESGWHIRLK